MYNTLLHNTGLLLSTNIVSWVPLVTACVAYFKPRTSSEWWAAVLIRHYPFPLVDGFQLLSFLLSYSQLELLSAARCDAFVMASFLA